MKRYVKVDRGAGSRPGQLLRHVDDPRRWCVVVYTGKNAKGRKTYRHEVVIGSKKAAENRLVELLGAKNTGKLIARTNETVASLVKRWLEHKTGKVEDRTLTGYRDALNLYVLPSLGHRKVAELKLVEIDGLYSDMQAGKLPKPETDDDGRSVGWKGKPLSPRTVKAAHAALNQALSQAVRWGLIPFNPAAEAEVPTGKPKEKRPLTAVERARFITASEGAFYKVFFRLLLDTGLRPGEACALTWAALDLAGDRLSVSKAVTQGSDGEAIISHPKTKKSRRTIPLFGLAPLMLEHRAWQAEHGINTELVFTNQVGEMVAPWTFNRRELERVLRAAGIKGAFSLYGFRHTFATLHLESGTPLKVVSEWLGHATISQTSDTYMHLSSEVGDDWAAKHVAFLRKSEEDTAAEAVTN